MYKDKDKQKEADRVRQRRKRDKIKVKGVTNEGVTVIDEKPNVTPKGDVVVIPNCNQVKTVVLIPGDEGYIGEPRSRAPDKPGQKRGKDIKCFANLPPDVQQTINSISVDAEDKARRTAIAIHYQHLFPDRYHSTGLYLISLQDSSDQPIATG